MGYTSPARSRTGTVANDGKLGEGSLANQEGDKTASSTSIDYGERLRGPANVGRNHRNGDRPHVGQ
jgi:hypothetical protein